MTASLHFDVALNVAVTQFSADEKDGKGGVVFHHAVGMNRLASCRCSCWPQVNSVVPFPLLHPGHGAVMKHYFDDNFLQAIRQKVGRVPKNMMAAAHGLHTCNPLDLQVLI